MSVSDRAMAPLGFVHAHGGRLVDGNDKELLLRGVGLGNWLLPEGYMWKFGPGGESPREIESLTLALLGSEGSMTFWDEFHDAFISESDIAMISESGFDHIRLPINSRIVMTEGGLSIESGFLLIDRVIDWCRKYNLWVLLDLHGAPGGQTGTNIDDSPHGKPELFMERRYWDQTIELWRLIATRYAKDPIVLGYDLLNEPLPNEWQYQFAEELIALYKEITLVIRSVDSDHLIVYEGTHWASNWEIFTEVLDANSMLQFHKYWNTPDLASIQRFIDTGIRLDLPIYMGESGENNIEWLYTAFRLFESQNIGWNFWPWKKIDTKTSPLSVQAPTGWEEIQKYAGGDRTAPPQWAKSIFEELLINMRTENCVRRPDILAAIFATNPLSVPAWGFGFRGRGASYSTRDAHPLQDMRSEDSVTLEFLHPMPGKVPNFEHNNGRPREDDEQVIVRLEGGDWLEFEVSPTTEISKFEVELAEGDPSSVKIAPSHRGFTVTAEAKVGLVGFRRRSQ